MLLDVKRPLRKDAWHEDAWHEDVWHENAWHEDAPCKVNGFLHLLGERHEGQYPLQSFLMFPKSSLANSFLGDEVLFAPDASLGKTVFKVKNMGNLAGFSALSSRPDDNLCWRAFSGGFALFDEPIPQGILTLKKEIPMGAGLGGGSTDAAAALRLVARLLPKPLSTFERFAADLGSDVPACLALRMCSVEGRGEIVNAQHYRLEHGYGVLVVPPVLVSTKKMYNALERTSPTLMPKRIIPSFVSTNWLLQQHNVFEDMCCHDVPQTKRILEALRSYSTCKLARVSGSGGGCFGLFEDASKAHDVAQTLPLKGHWIRVVAF